MMISIGVRVNMPNMGFMVQSSLGSADRVATGTPAPAPPLQFSNSRRGSPNTKPANRPPSGRLAVTPGPSDGRCREAGLILELGGRHFHARGRARCIVVAGH